MEFNVLTIKLIKNELKSLDVEKIIILKQDKNTNRLFEITRAELILKGELIKLLETQLNKKNNLKKAG